MKRRKPHYDREKNINSTSEDDDLNNSNDNILPEKNNADPLNNWFAKNTFRHDDYYNSCNYYWYSC